MAKKFIFTFLLLLSAAVEARTNSTAAPGACAAALEQLQDCIDYLTKKTEDPSQPCCVAARRALPDPANRKCFCSFVAGAPKTESLGIDEGRVKKLPATCQLNSTTISCPKLAPGTGTSDGGRAVVGGGWRVLAAAVAAGLVGVMN